MLWIWCCMGNIAPLFPAAMWFGIPDYRRLRIVAAGRRKCLGIKPAIAHRPIFMASSLRALKEENTLNASSHREKSFL